MPNLRRSIVILLSLGVLSFAFIALNAEAKNSKSHPKVVTTSMNRGNLTVFAAASLTEVLPKLSAAFRVKNPGISFTFSFGASSTLSQQVLAGAPVDLFFSAGPVPMASLRTAAQLDGVPRNFTSNSLVIAVPRSNPAKIRSIADLAKPGVKFLLCAPQVPCGMAAAKVLALANVHAQPVSLENDVKSVLNKIALNEADAGLVYRTDITRDVTAIEIPEAASAINEYPVAVIKASRSSIAAHAFMNFVLSKSGQAILQKAGFGKP